MPFLRYDLEDRVWLDRSPKPCPCGRSFPTVRRIDGRAEDLLKGIDGRFVAAAYLGMDGIEGVRGVQIIQDAADHLLLRVLAEKCADRDAVRIRLQDRVVRILGPGTRIDVEWFDEEVSWRDSKTKFRIVINQQRS